MHGNDLPRLRQHSRGEAKTYGLPTAIVGDVVDADREHVTIVMREQVTTLFVEDLHEALGGPDMALGLLLDAAGNGDRVKIALQRGKITYDNAAQTKRFKER